MRIRSAELRDLAGILEIYNQGIEDRMSTFDAEMKDMDYIQKWFIERKGKYIVLVAINEGKVIGWATVSPYNPCYIYSRVGDLAIYVHRLHRNQGVGHKLLNKLELIGKATGFHKYILFMFSHNEIARFMFEKNGYSEVGVHQEHAFMGGQFVDVNIMEKLLRN